MYYIYRTKRGVRDWFGLILKNVKEDVSDITTSGILHLQARQFLHAQGS